jgi:hypothetical protein
MHDYASRATGARDTYLITVSRGSRHSGALLGLGRESLSKTRGRAALMLDNTVNSLQRAQIQSDPFLVTLDHLAADRAERLLAFADFPVDIFKCEVDFRHFFLLTPQQSDVRGVAGYLVLAVNVCPKADSGRH